MLIVNKVTKYKSGVITLLFKAEFCFNEDNYGIN